MATGTHVEPHGPGRDAPAQPLPKHKAEVERLVHSIVADVAALEDATLARLLPALRDAMEEVKAGLAKWLAQAPAGNERFTAQQLRAALVSLDAAFDAIAELKPAAVAALGYSHKTGGALAVGHVKEELARLGAVFGESIRPTQIATASVLARTDKLLLQRYRTSAQRYAGAVGEDIRHQLMVGLARGETFHQLTERLRFQGGPRGLVSLRGGVPDAHFVVEDIGEGLFKRYRHWAERVVRTEVIEAYNVQHATAIDLLNEDLDEDEEPFLYRWDASADSRTCRLCRGLHGRVSIIGQPFEGGFLRPPAHPCCRCTILAWHASWGDIKGEIPALGEVPTGLSKKALSAYHPKPAPAGYQEPQPLPPGPPKPPKIPSMTAEQKQSLTAMEELFKDTKDPNSAFYVPTSPFATFEDYVKAQHAEYVKMGKEGNAAAAVQADNFKLYRDVLKARDELKAFKLQAMKAGKAKAAATKPTVTFGPIWDARTPEQMEINAALNAMSPQARAGYIKKLKKATEAGWELSPAPHGGPSVDTDPVLLLRFLEDSKRIDRELAALRAWEAKHTPEGRARAKAERAAARKAKAEAAAAAAVVKDAAATPELLRSELAGGMHGVSFTGDGDQVENHAVKVRRVTGVDGSTYFEFSYKLTPWQEAAAQRAMVKEKSREIGFTFRSRKLTPKGMQDTADQAQHVGRAMRHASGQVELELGLDGATRNLVRVRVATDDPKVALAAFESSSRALGVTSPNKIPTQEDRDFAVKAKVVGKFAPFDLPRPGLTVEAVRKQIEETFQGIAAEHPVALEILKDATWKDMGGGHRALYSKALAKHMASGLGKVKGLYHDARVNVENLASVLQHGGMSSLARYDAGLFVTGMSTGADFESGGADGFFTRVNTGKAASYGGAARFHIDNDELGRLDWWAFDHDEFGRAGPNQYNIRWTADKMRDTKAPPGGNEVMFPKGVRPEHIDRLVVADPKAVIAELRRRGVTEIGGRKLEDVVVGP